MHTVTYRLHSVEETIAWGRHFGEQIDEPLTILLEGDLGAGKTHMSQAIAQGLGVTETVTSPTFAIMNTYRSGRQPLYHFDLYRLENEAELENIGFYEYVRDGVSLIEWPNAFMECMPRRYVLLRLTITGDTSRELTVVSRSYSETQLKEWGGPTCI